MSTAPTAVLVLSALSILAGMLIGSFRAARIVMATALQPVGLGFEAASSLAVARKYEYDTARRLAFGTAANHGLYLGAMILGSAYVLTHRTPAQSQLITTSVLITFVGLLAGWIWSESARTPDSFVSWATAEETEAEYYTRARRYGDQLLQVQKLRLYSGLSVGLALGAWSMWNNWSIFAL